MKTLLLILGYLIADSALADPCVNHTVLDQPWRSTECKRTECTGQRKWKCDANLDYGWYRFKSSDGWKIPETVVPEYRCSTSAPGWLNGSHPTVGQGEVTRTACFHWAGNRCHWTREIKIRNCSSYFVYELKPSPRCYAAYCTDADSALTDPCEDHTVLDQPWRSTDCSGTECTGQWKCDDNLDYRWYRFKSSGGWKIPETVVPDHHCSTHSPGWINGSHPTVGQGEVTNTACFHWSGNPCYRTQEIKIKNCSSYSVYELKPTPWCRAYCTDPETSPSQEPEKQSTRGSADHSSTVTAGSAASDPGTSPTQEPEEQSTRGSAERSSTVTVGSAASAPETSSTQEPEEQSTRDSTGHSSSNPAGSAALDPGTPPTQEPEEQSTRGSTEHLSTVPLGSATSDRETSPTQEPEEQSTQDSTDHSSSKPVGSAASDSGRKTSPRANTPSTSEAECKLSEAGHARPGVLQLTDEECEMISAEVQVMYVGKSKLDTPEKQEAYLRQVQDMLKDHLPCKKLPLKFKDVKPATPEKKKRK